MSWLMPSRFRPEDRERLEALVAEGLSERERAVEVTTAVRLQTEADQERAQATIGGIHERISRQLERAAARQAATTADARARRLLGDLMTDAGGKVTQ